MSETHFVKVPCQHCGGHIEFDANDLVPENNIVPCPHCGLETKVYIPEIGLTVKTKEVRSFPDDTDGFRAPEWWKDLPATPRQVAYLTYMGVQVASALSKKQASDLIDEDPFYGEAKTVAALERVCARKRQWDYQRLILHPNLYGPELEYFLKQELPEALHGYVRKHMVGASQKLTKAKIRHVVDCLSKEKGGWWQQPDYPIVFFRCLTEMYPGCCDGVFTP